MAAKNEAKIRFTAETKDFNAGIKAANNELSDLKSELKVTDAEMKANGVSVEGLRKKQENLTAQLSAASDKTQALSEKLKVAERIFGENSDEATKLRSQLANAQVAEVKLQSALDECNHELTRQEKGFAEASEAAEEAGEGFTIFKGACADLVSNGIQAIISGIGDLAKSFYGLADETREYREDIGKLESAFATAGHTTEEATETYKDLYAVFGEEDRAVEAAQQIAKLAENEEEMATLTNIATGAWAMWGDSLATESLMEAANSTAKIGEVQGTLADALEWCGVNLDDYNEKLGSLKTEEERKAYILETLNGLYSESADNYRETNGQIMDANRANSAYTDSLAALGEKIEPVTSAVKLGFAGILDEVMVLMQDVDLVGFADTIKVKFEEFAGKITDVVNGFKSVSEWITNNTLLLTGLAIVIGSIAAGIGAYNIVMGIKAAMDAAGATSLWGFVTAQIAANTAMLASPITWVVAGIVALIAIIVLCIVYWDEIKAAIGKAWDWVVEKWGQAAEWFNTTVIQPVLNFFSGLWDGIKNAFSAAWEWIKSTPIFQFYSQLFQSIWEYISSVISVIVELFKGAWEIIKAVWGIVAGWFNTNIVQPISGFFRNLWSGVSNAASNAWNKLKSGAQSAWNGIKSIFGSVASYFGKIFGDAWSKVKSVFSTGGKIFSGITEGITAAFKKVVNAIISGINRVVSIPFNSINNVLSRIRNAKFLGIQPFSGLGSISIPKIPLLAGGGILKQPTLNIAGEAGPEAVIPIDKLQSYIGAAIDKTYQAVNMQALVAAVEDLANRPIELSVNGRQFAVATATERDNVDGNRLALARRGLAL